MNLQRQNSKGRCQAMYLVVLLAWCNAETSCCHVSASNGFYLFNTTKFRFQQELLEGKEETWTLYFNVYSKHWTLLGILPNTYRLDQVHRALVHSYALPAHRSNKVPKHWNKVLRFRILKPCCWNPRWCGGRAPPDGNISFKTVRLNSEH